MLKATTLTCNHRTNPAGVALTPSFSWQIESDRQGVLQTRRKIVVARNASFSNPAWDSGEAACGKSIHVPCAVPLSPQTRYFWRVKIWDNHGDESEWSEPQSFITQLDEFKAPFISGETEGDAGSSKGTMLRGEFTVKPNLELAVVNATALGVYRLTLNGVRVGDSAMTPGWTEYGSRLLYQSYDVTSFLKEGGNAAGAMVGPGWYKGDLAGWLGLRNVFGVQTAFSMQLTLRYAGGFTETVCAQPDWKAYDAPVLYSEIYHGEIYDARMELPGWDTYGFDDSGWRMAEPVKCKARLIAPQDGPAVRARENLTPTQIFTAPNGERIVDFGQNMTGWVRLTVRGNAGDVVEYSHAEVLDKDGNFYTGNLRAAKEKISYTLKGNGTEVYEPYFSFQGFRYIRIDKFPGNAAPENFTAVVAHSDMPEIGSFKSSHEKLNRLMENVRWGMKGNFFDIPTDCPQRDERLGWTGDAQVFIRAACYWHDTAGFFRKWLRDMSAAQKPDGVIPNVVPDILTGNMPEDNVADTNTGATGWGDAGVICPWTAYLYSGDITFLEENYPMMKGWVEFIRSRAEQGLIWSKDKQLGDWVALDAKEGSYFGATPTDLIATAYYAYCAGLLAKTAALLGKDSDARAYFALQEEISGAFTAEFFTPTGRLAARTQTAHILALHFGLTPAKFRPRTIETLVEIIHEHDNHLSTGFLGTPYICYALSENGRLDLAYELLLKEDYPSWLYPLSKGATTIWEHWDGMKPDGTMWSDGMNSFNHYAYGAVADWVFSVVGGIDSDDMKPGYRKSKIAPRPGGGLTFARTSQQTPYGELVSDWKIDGAAMTLDVKIPHNTTAEIVLPMGHISGCGGLRFAFDGKGQAAEAGSGIYRFTVENI